MCQGGSGRGPVVASISALTTSEAVVLAKATWVVFESLSSAVRAGLQGKAGNGKPVKVETLTKKGKLVAYEAQVLTDGKKSEVQVGPDGKALEHEE